MMKFICDGMLGKLCKNLRICGIDTLYSNEGIKALLVARREGRTFLTMNTRLKGKEGVFFIESKLPDYQLITIITEFHLVDKLKFFSRCLLCNEPLISVAKEKVKGRIPYYTYKNFSEFSECPRCQRVYWKGSHYEKMARDVKVCLGKLIKENTTTS